MKAFKYKEIMPRVAVEKLKLIEPDELVSLIGKDIESLSYFLATSPYRNEILKIPVDKKNDPIFIEAALNENYAKTFKKLTKFSQGEIRHLLLAISKKFEAANIKTLLRAVQCKMDPDEAAMHIIPLGTFDRDRCRALLTGAKTIEDVINSLPDLEYASIIKKTLGGHSYSLDLLPLEIALDKAVYESILESVEKLNGLDKDMARSILGVEIDSANIKVILRGKSMGLNQSQLKDYLMPPSLISESVIEEMIRAPDLKSTIERFSRAIVSVENPFYRNIFDQILKDGSESLVNLEVFLDRAPLKMSLLLLKKYSHYYNIGFILAFLNLKWLEIRNLRCLTIGLQRKIPPNQIKKFITLPNEL